MGIDANGDDLPFGVFVFGLIQHIQCEIFQGGLYDFLQKWRRNASGFTPHGQNRIETVYFFSCVGRKIRIQLPGNGLHINFKRQRFVILQGLKSKKDGKGFILVKKNWRQHSIVEYAITAVAAGFRIEGNTHFA